MLPSGAHHSFGLLVDVSAHEAVAGASRHPSQPGVVAMLAHRLADAFRHAWAALTAQRAG